MAIYHIIACRSEYRLGTTRRNYQGTCSWLNQQRRKPAEEIWRKAALQVIAVFAGITSAWLARLFQTVCHTISLESWRVVFWLAAAQDSGIQF
jgi:hypothetical protein